MTTAVHDLSADQLAAHDAILSWYFSLPKGPTRAPVLTMGGYAGSGKTTTMGAVTKSLKHVWRQKHDDSMRIGFSCFTGKAALVLKTKLQVAGVLDEGDGNDYCGTMHGLIYAPKFKKGVLIGWGRVDKSEMTYDLLVVDEGSMVDEELFKDLSSYRIPILVIGDHGQLPPVKAGLNLMDKPMIRLEKIHRQAEGSPIIRLSMMARLEGRIPIGVYGPGVFKTGDATILDRLRDPKAGVVLCATNRTRGRLNMLLRRRCGHHSARPEIGEPIVALRNDREAGVYNGMVGELGFWGDKCPTAGRQDENGRIVCPKACHRHAHVRVDFRDADEPWEGPALREQFGAEKTLQFDPKKGFLGGQFDWAYALTVHKFQGSEAANVIVVEETDYMDDETRRRWLYTAVTRSKEKLVIIGR